MKNDTSSFTHLWLQKLILSKELLCSCFLLTPVREKGQTQTITEWFKSRSTHAGQTEKRQCLTCTWCSRRTGLTGRWWRPQNERWISRKAWEAPQGTSQPSQQDSVCAKQARAQSAAFRSVSVAGLSVRPDALDPNLSTTLNQVLHVPFDRVQVFLDVVEVLHGLVRSHTACVTLVLDRADLFQGLGKGVSAATKERCTLQAGEPLMCKNIHTEGHTPWRTE